MRTLLALVALSFALGGCCETTYCHMVRADTCVSSMPGQALYGEDTTPDPEPVYVLPAPTHRSTVIAETIVNVNGDHDIVNINHYESGTARTAAVRVQAPPPPARSPRAFDPDAARVSLHSVDLSSCRVDGGGGDGHARVTFSGAGDISAVVIDGPRGLGQRAVTCIGSKLATAHVPGFDGDPVTAGIGYYVP